MKRTGGHSTPSRGSTVIPTAGWLEPLPVLLVVLLLRIGDPFFPFDALRIGLEFLGDFLNIFWLPTSNLDESMSAQLVKRLCKGWPNPVDLLEIIFLLVLGGLGLSR